MNPLVGTLENSEYSDEMQSNAVFYQSLHCFLRFKQQGHKCIPIYIP